MAYRLSMKNSGSAFYVPGSVVDGLRDYTAAELRILLYALSLGGSAATEAGAARALGISESDAKDYLDFWARRGILESTDAEETPARSEPANPQTEVKPVRVKPTMDEIRRIVKSDPAVRFALDEAERILGTTFTTSDTSTVVWIITWLGMPAEVFITIVQWCANHGSKSFRYIEKMSVDWADRGIDSIEKAEECIRLLEVQSSWEGHVMNAAGIRGRELLGKEKEICDSWNNMGIPLELVKLAAEKTAEQTGKISFPYMNKILVSWKKKGIDTPEKAMQEPGPGTSKQEKRASYDIDEISRSFDNGDDLA